jgi:hypothetical protein
MRPDLRVYSVTRYTYKRNGHAPPPSTPPWSRVQRLKPGGGGERGRGERVPDAFENAEHGLKTRSINASITVNSHSLQAGPVIFLNLSHGGPWPRFGTNFLVCSKSEPATPHVSLGLALALRFFASVALSVHVITMCLGRGGGSALGSSTQITGPNLFNTPGPRPPLLGYDALHRGVPRVVSHCVAHCGFALRRHCMRIPKSNVWACADWLKQ